MENLERIKLLVRLLNEAAYNYYTLDSPSMSDEEYDLSYRELVDLETKSPDLIQPDSPTRRVGDKVLDKFEKVNHANKMMSINDVFDENEVSKFIKDMNKETNKVDLDFSCELKIDGLSVSCVYKKGLLVQASTRGDGTTGEDITNNVMCIPDVPLKLPMDIDIEVRGEIYMPKETLVKINEKRKREGLEPMANCRNAASGTIKSLDPKVVKERGLRTFMYQIVDDMTEKTQTEDLKRLKRLGFKTNDDGLRCSNIDEIMSYIRIWSEKKNELSYPVDGIVVKINDKSLYNSIGYTIKCPKWVIAYKYPAEEAETILREIKYQVGRTGVITPLAIFDTVSVSGTNVSRATLHNEDYIKLKDIRIGDTIKVRKSGEIIPEVARVVLEKRPKDSLEFKFTNTCPVCGKPLVRMPGEAATYCVNPDCKAQLINKLIHFASKNAMNIEGLGDKMCEQLFNAGLIKDIPSIYFLRRHKDVLLEMEGMGERSVELLLDAIDKSKKNNLDRLLFGLGIKNIGSKAATLLAKKLKTIDALMEAKDYDIRGIDSFGDTMINSVLNYFHNSGNKTNIKVLKSVGVNTEYISEQTSDKLEGLNFVITGTLPTLSRTDASKLIKEHGGEILSSVSKKTNYLLAGEAAGSKLEKAQKLNVPIISEDEFLNMIN